MKEDKKIVLEIKDFVKYYGKARGTDGVTFDVYSGEIFGFIGPNGAGKSTTIRAIMGTIFKTSGVINVFSLDAGKNSKEIKKELGYVPAEVEYYKYMKVKDLLNYANSFLKRSKKDEITSLAKELDLDLNRKISELSFGNKKKVAIIQAIIRKPKLLILDEGASGLDPLIQSKLFGLLNKLKKEGVAILLSSHNLAEVEKYCDRVGVIKDGKIVKIEDVKKSKNINTKLVYVKTKEKEERYKYEGNINELIKKIGKENIIDLEIKNEGLEDEFMAWYN